MCWGKYAAAAAAKRLLVLLRATLDKNKRRRSVSARIEENKKGNKKTRKALTWPETPPRARTACTDTKQDMVNTTIEAAKGRARGTSVTERRAAEQAAMMADEAAKQAAKKTKSSKASTVRGAVVHTLLACAATSAGVPAAACALGRGRAARNAAFAIGGDVESVEKQKATLLKKAEWRPTSRVTDVAPAGTSKLGELPDRDAFAAGAAGAAQFSEAMMDFVDENFSGAGIEARSADEHEKRAGFFGYWHERRGHGACVEWRQEANGWRLHALADETGKMVVPSLASVLEFVLLVSDSDR